MGDTRTRQAASILLVDPLGGTTYVEYLRPAFNVSVARTVDDAMTMLPDLRPALVIAELAFDLDGTTMCRAAKALPHAPPILITTSTPELAPYALIAGCQAILVKPFEPRVLVKQVGRLLLGDDSPTLDAVEQSRNSPPPSLAEPSTGMARATTMMWPDAECPQCGEGNCVSFDALGERRTWWACLHCRTVWVAPRREL